jgi:hypothetical protein
VTAVVILRSGPRGRVSKDELPLHRASQDRQSSKCPKDQCLFLFPAPALDLPFSGSSIFEAVKMLMEHQFDGSPQGGVSVEIAGLMLGHPPFQSSAVVVPT